MPENICPVCGMINAEDSTFCWSCKSPLKTPPGSTPGSGQGAEESSSQESNAGAEAVPDWLSRIRAKSQMEQETNNLAQSVLPGDGTSAGESGNEAVSDWLKELRGVEPSAPQEADQDAVWAGTAAEYTPIDMVATPKTAKPQPEEESDDLLKNLAEWKPKETIGLEDEMPADQAEAPLTPSEVVPGVPFSESITPAEEKKPADTNFPDWLSKIARNEESAPAEPAVPEEQNLPESQSAEPAEKSQEIPDWLSRITPPAGSEPSDVQPSTPDWLGEPAKAGEAAAPEKPATEEPDWLRGLGRAGQPAQEPESEEKPGQAVPSAFEETPIISQVSATPPEAIMPAEESAAAAAELPDWLGALKQQFTETGQPEIPAAPASEVKPETPLQEAPVSEAPISEVPVPQVPVPQAPESHIIEPSIDTGNVLPDWLTEIRQPVQNEPVAQETEPPAEQFEPPLEDEGDRLQSVIQPETPKPSEIQPAPGIPQPLEVQPSPETPAETEPVISLSENVTTPQAETVEPAASEEPSEPTSGENIPGKSESDQFTGAAAPFEAETPIADGVLPDWLKDLAQPSEEELTAAESKSGATQEKAEAEVSAFFESTPADTMPVKDILAARRAKEEAERAESSAGELENGTSETAAGADPAAKEPPSTPIKDIPFTSELLEQTPAWLKELESMQPAEPSTQLPSQPPESAPAFQFGPEENEEPLPVVPAPVPYESEFNTAPAEGVLPDWLEELKPETNTDTPAPETSAPTAAFIEEEPGAEAAATSTMSEMEKSKPFSLGGELPDWLSTHWQAENNEGENSEAKISMASLPGWVQALRPLDALDLSRFSSEADSRVENKGPLAGFAGVLPGDTLPLNYPRPPLYSTKLHVSERQKVQATLLEQMVKETSTEEEDGSKSQAVAQRLYRMVTGLVLIGILVYSLFFGFKLLPVSSLAPAQVTAVHDALAQLPADSAVLVAVDYEAGLSGEVKQVALPVVEQLMAQNAYLALLSTSVNGPALGDDLIRSANADVNSYKVAQNVVNLGYLAGGTTGLQSFAHEPAETVPNTWLGTKAWPDDVFSLAGGSQIDQFAAVVVLTDSPETARAWIEQVQPALNGKPLFFVVSAQAAPLVQPYVASGQVSGMVAGLEDAAVYEQLTQRSGNASAFLGAYQTGLIVLAVLILVGGVLQWVTSFLKNRKAVKGA